MLHWVLLLTLVAAAPVAAQGWHLDLGASASVPIGAFGEELGEEVGSAKAGAGVSAQFTRGVGSRFVWSTVLGVAMNPMANPLAEAFIGDVEFGSYYRLIGTTGVGRRIELMDGLDALPQLRLGAALFQGPIWEYETEGIFSGPTSGKIDYGLSLVPAVTAGLDLRFESGWAGFLNLNYVHNVVFRGEGEQQGYTVRDSFQTAASSMDLGVSYRVNLGG